MKSQISYLEFGFVKTINLLHLFSLNKTNYYSV